MAGMSEQTTSCIVPGLYRIPTPTPFPVGAANVYLYKGGDCLTLFDAGTKTEAAWGVLTCRLRELGVEPSDIDRIILTHHHLDHLGLSRRIRDVSSATVIAHPDVPTQIPYMFDESSAHVHLDALMRELGVPADVAEKVIALRQQHRELLDDFVVDEPIADNGRVGNFTAHFRPGHSSTDTVFVHSDERWALTGDHLIRNVTPNPILRRRSESGLREQSLVQYCNALRETRTLEMDWCFAGHGSPFQDHRAVVDATLRHIERRGAKVLAATPAEGATPYQITKALFRRLSEPNLYYCLSAATGHLELLATQDMLKSEYRKDVLFYLPIRT